MLLVVTLSALAVLAYTYVGYPAVLGLLARVAGGDCGTGDRWTPSVTACIPAFNVAAHLPAKLDSLLALDYPAELLEILVYSDGATDETDEVVRRYAARDPRVRLLGDGVRRGKPYAVNRMRGAATGEVLLMTDARQPLSPSALGALVACLASPEVGCVSGNLVLRGGTGAGVYWRYENWIRRQEGRFRGMTGVTGPIYAIRRADMAALPDDVILDDMWVPMRLALAGRTIRFAEQAVAEDDAFGDDREFGRKVRTLAGNYQLFALLPALLSPLHNRIWFETISHKLMRLLCPWALVALLVASSLALRAHAADPGLLRLGLGALVGGQAVLYGAALAGGRLGKLGTVSRTFVVLNAAAVVGLWRFLRGAQKVTW